MFYKGLLEGKELWIVHVMYGGNMPSDGLPDSYIYHTKKDALEKVREIAKDYDFADPIEKKYKYNVGDKTITVLKTKIKEILYPVERKVIELR